MNLDPDYLSTLPPEVLLTILQDLSARDITSVCQSSQYLNSFCYDWSIWEKKAFEDFYFPRDLFKQTNLRFPLQRYQQVRAYSYHPEQFLVSAVRSGQMELFDWLLRSGAASNAKALVTALDAAAATGNSQAVKRLLEYLDLPPSEPEEEAELDLYYADVEGWLEWAQKSKLFGDASVEDLLEHNSINDLILDILRPAVEAAQRNGHDEIFNELVQLWGMYREYQD